MIKKIVIARHHGFCMGVKRAIKIAEETAAEHTDPVNILNEIVHNEAVVERFLNEGVGQVTSVDDVDSGTLIISAHGVAPKVIEKAEAKGLNVVNATCPLVANIYEIIERIVARGYRVIHFGDEGHDETAGVVGHAPDKITVLSDKQQLDELPEWKDQKLGMTIQTTADKVQAREIKRLAREKWPQMEFFDTICNATSQRQSAILEIADEVDMALVVGSQTSANSKRLAEISKEACGRAYLINSDRDIDPAWFDSDGEVENIGVTAGASTPAFLVEAVIERLIDISGGNATVVRHGKNKKERANVKTTA